jgi:hypothetical protein
MSREYKLIVKKEILEVGDGDLGICFKAYNIGDIIRVNLDTFKSLQSGETIVNYTRMGSIKFDKYNFENEVEFVEVILTYGTQKLGQRKNK